MTVKYLCYIHIIKIQCICQFLVNMLRNLILKSNYC